MFFSALLAIAAINLLGFAAFGLDKARARNGDWRISEAQLLGIALLGGSVGAKAGQRVFRHKTRKQPFARNLNAILALHGVLAMGASAAPLVVAALPASVVFPSSVADFMPPIPEAAETPTSLPHRFGPGSSGWQN